jgi:dTDP-4-amino-4,6-dideoxygalactose transaminase
MHQASAAYGRVQLRHYDRRCVEIRKAMNHFWDLLEGVPGIRAHRADEKIGSHMGGWFRPHGLYRPEELGGLSITRFCEAVKAEGVFNCHAGCNLPLHIHPVFNNADIYGHGRPTRIANSERDLRQPKGSLPVAENIGAHVFHVPWFKHFRPREIAQYAEAFKKASAQAEALRKDDPGNPDTMGGWSFTAA